MSIRLDVAVLEGMAREHVFYEVDRLVWWSHVQLPANWFAVPPHDQPERSELVQLQVAQATLDSALVHLRNAVEFLIASRPMAEANRRWTDLVADDYFDHGGPRQHT